MITRGFGMGFGRRFLGEDFSKVREDWDKMSDSEKLDFMNKRMKDSDCHEGHLSVEAIDARCEAWMKKTPEEKQASVDSLKKHIHEKMHAMKCFHHGMGHFGFASEFMEDWFGTEK